MSGALIGPDLHKDCKNLRTFFLTFKMPPNPETLEESDENVQSRRPTSLLNSVHLVRMADNEMTSRTPSPSSSRSSPVSLLRVTPYQKEVPDWESPGLRVRVTDIVKQFEDINKRGKEYDDRYRNESRSSGIGRNFGKFCGGNCWLIIIL